MLTKMIILMKKMIIIVGFYTYKSMLYRGSLREIILFIMFTRTFGKILKVVVYENSNIL